MANRLQDQLEDPGPSVFYEPAFRQIVEDHLTWLQNHSTTETTQIKPRIAHACDGDFYCVLDHYDIPREFQWITLRVNAMNSPLEYRSDQETMLLCAPNTIQRLTKVYRSNRRQARKERGSR